MLEAIGSILICGGFLFFINWLIAVFNPSKKQWYCDNKVAYDTEYDMWFTGCDWHECGLCKNDNK